MSLAYSMQTLYDEFIVKNHYDKQFRFATADIPILGDFSKVWDAWNYSNDYIHNRGLSWDDIKYPTMLKGANNGMYSLFQPSGKAVERLYKDDEKKYVRNLRNEHYRTAISANNMRRAWYYSRM